MTVVSGERARQVTAAPTGTGSAAALASAAAGALMLFVPGVVAFGPVFGGYEGYLAAGGGVLVGVLISVLGARFRWSGPTVVATLLGAYLVLGGPLALRKTTLFGIIPTPETFLRLVPLTVQSWRDLLTVTPPASAFTGPAIVPYVSGLVLGAIAGRLVLSERRYLWTLLPALAMLVIGILWGLDYAPWAAFIGAGFGLIAIVWSVWRSLRQRAQDQTALLAGTAMGFDARRLVTAGVAVLAAGGVALAASPFLGGTTDRQVLRQVVQPPLNLEDYASPLTSYRYLELDQEKVSLFTVSGLPAGARIRLATMDAYDGHVYNVADASAGFLRIGDRLGARAGAAPATLDVAIKAYEGVWVPGGGEIRSVAFTGPRAAKQAESLYYNFYGGTLLTTAGLQDGDAYRVQTVVPAKVEDSDTLRVSQSSSAPSNDRVPDIVGKLATDFAGDASSPLKQLRNIEKNLQEGYYDNGKTNNSRAGHSAERIATMLTGAQLIGDDEQYAVAMALMARQLGIPARVVMGFYPDEPASGTLDVQGSMAHVWVEVPFEGVGALTFDPTPPKTRTPQTVVPKPRPNPKPQVLPPPEQPPNKAQDPQDDPGKKRDKEDTPGDDLLLRIALGVGIGVGVAALVSSPFVTILALKKRRRTKRLNAPVVADRIGGGWNEVVDAATDLGTTVPPLATRREASTLLSEAYPSAPTVALAEVVDAGVFGASAPTAEGASTVWVGVDETIAAMRSHVGRWRRFLAAISIRSFGRPTLKLPRVSVRGIKAAGASLRRPRKASE